MPRRRAALFPGPNSSSSLARALPEGTIGSNHSAQFPRDETRVESVAKIKALNRDDPNAGQVADALRLLECVLLRAHDLALPWDGG